MKIIIESHKEKYTIKVVNGPSVIREECVDSIEERDSLVWFLAEKYDVMDIQFADLAVKHIPELEYENSPESLTLYIEDNKELISNHILESIEDAMNTGKDEVDIISIKSSSQVYRSKRSNWISGLGVILEYFTEKEDYEKCNRVQRLINDLL